MISDYTVYLKFVESGTQLLCDVTRISQATVVCQPPLNSITIPAHTPNLLADLQVILITDLQVVLLADSQVVLIIADLQESLLVDLQVVAIAATEI